MARAPEYPDVRIFMAAFEWSHEELIDLRKVQIPWTVPSSGIGVLVQILEFSLRFCYISIV